MPNALTDITLTEISGVDNPAQEPAIVALVKNRSGRMPETTHTTDTGDPEMSKEIEKRLEVLEKVASLTGAQKSFYDGLDTDELKTEFLEKSAEDKDKDVETAQKAADEAKAKEEANKSATEDTSTDGDTDNPVVYKSKTGAVARKNDSEALVQALKSADESAEKLEKMELTKRASDEFGNFSKTATTNEALCKALDTLPTKDREAVVKALSSHVKVSEVAQTTVSKSDGGSAADTAEFDEKLEELRKSHPNAADIDLRRMAYDQLSK